MICLLLGHKPKEAVAIDGPHKGRMVEYCEACGNNLGPARESEREQRRSGYRDYEVPA